MINVCVVAINLLQILPAEHTAVGVPSAPPNIYVREFILRVCHSHQNDAVGFFIVEKL